MQTASISGNVTANSEERYFRSAIGQTVGSELILTTGGATSVGFYLKPPPGGMVQFQGSWTKIKWKDLTLRQMGAHGYVTQAEDEEDYIGSCATFQYIRLYVSRGGSAPGEVRGRFSPMMSTLEGIEHGYAPHKIGAEVQAKWFAYSSVVTNGTIAFPAHEYHKLVITDIHFTASDTASLITISEGSVANGNLIFRGNAKPVGGSSLFFPISFTLPHVFKGTNTPLCISSSGAATLDGVVHYYESQ